MPRLQKQSFRLCPIPNSRRRLTAAPVQASLAGLLGNIIYPSSTAWAAFVALSNLSRPGNIANVVFDVASTSIYPETQMRLFATMTIPLVAAAYRCFLATKRDNLTSDTYQRLTILLAGSFAVTAKCIAIVGPGFNPLTQVGKVFVAWHVFLAFGLLCIWYFKSKRPTYILKDTLTGAGEVLSPPVNLASAFYGALALACVVGGGMIIAQPLPSEAPAAAMQSIFAGRLALLSLVAYTLKNGSDRNRLHKGTFRLLNDSLSVASGIAAAVLYRANQTVTPLTAGLGIVALLCIIIRLTSKGDSIASSSTEIGDNLGYEYQKIKDPMDALCSDDPDADECRVFDS